MSFAEGLLSIKFPEPFPASQLLGHGVGSLVEGSGYE